MNTPQTVYWIDDCKTEHDSLAMQLESQNIRLSHFAHPDAFLAACAPDIRGCAVLEHRLPGMDGITLLKEMQRRGYTLPVIFLSGYGTIAAAVQCIKAGALDFLTKPVEESIFLSNIHLALEQDAHSYMNKQDQHGIMEKLATLTEREREIMMLAVEGNTNKGIAQQLMISHRTVEIHRARILQKTGATNLLELARRSGMLRHPNQTHCP